MKYLPSYHLFLHGGLQALWNVYAASDRNWKMEYETDLIKMPDGGTIAIDWANPEPETLRK